jgi:ribosome biogenesis protein Tsr3
MDEKSIRIRDRLTPVLVLANTNYGTPIYVDIMEGLSI